MDRIAGRLALRCAALCLGLLAFAPAAGATPGVLDPTFNPAGPLPGTVLTAPGGSPYAIANGVAVQPDGRIVSSGWASVPGGVAFAVTRHNADGTLDTTFNPAGPVPGTTTVSLRTTGSAWGYGLALQGDGKILVAGYAEDHGTYEFAVARYTATGTLDPTFNPTGPTPGVVLTPIGQHAEARSVAVQPDGRIVVAGYSSNTGTTQFTVVRYTADGALDPTFNPAGPTPGVVLTPAGLVASSVVVQDDGRIVVSGYTIVGGAAELAVARYTATGALDTTFAAGGATPGVAVTPVGEGVFAFAFGNTLAVQDDGRIVVAGSAGDGAAIDFAVVRFTADGALDPTFNPGGPAPGSVLTRAAGGRDGFATGVVLQPGGRIVIAGYESALSTYELAVARYTPDGALDTTFDPAGTTPGVALVPLGDGPNSEGIAVALQPDGRIVVAGDAVTGSEVRFALARFDAEAPDVVAPGLTSSLSANGGAGPVSTGGKDYYRGQVLLHLHATDSGSGVAKVTCLVDGSQTRTFVPGQAGVPGTVGAADVQFTVDFNTAGSRSYSCTATDVAGNTGTATAGSFVIDDTAPVTTATTSPAGGVGAGSVSVTLDATDPSPGAGVDHLTLSVDGGPSSTVTGSTATRTFTSQGAHTVQYGAVDRVGNAEALRTITVYVDRTRPGAARVNRYFVPVGATYDGILAGTASDDLGVAKVEVHLDDAIGRITYSHTFTATCTGCGTPGTTNVTWSVDFTGRLPARGNYLATIVVTDLAGNTRTTTDAAVIVQT